jgi:hypothetical protein
MRAFVIFSSPRVAHVDEECVHVDVFHTTFANKQTNKKQLVVDKFVAA